jgi:hypothetical protein
MRRTYWAWTAVILGASQVATVEGVVSRVPPTAKNELARLEPELLRAGREGSLSLLPPRGTERRSGDRVEYSRGAAITEWYVAQPGGLEQGFTVQSRPDGERDLVLELGMADDVSPQLAGDGSAVILRDASGAEVARYADLDVRDARGQSLGATLRATGRSIAISVDDRDAVYPIVVDPLLSQQAELVASDGASGNDFGYAVAMSGTTAVVGAWQGQSNHSGAVYVYVQSGASWTLQQELFAADATSNDGFGISVAISGNSIVVGSHQTNLDTGAAYVFAQSGGAWTQQAKLTPSDGASSDYFGASVAIDGSTIVVGNERAIGRAYVFSQSGATWTQQAELTAADGASGDSFGNPVAVSGSTILVGAAGKRSATGAAYVFAGTGGVWTQQQELVAGDGATGDVFGSRLAINGTTALVGAMRKNSSTGAAYVFGQSGTTWSQQQELLASDGASNAQFGSAIALNGATAVIGASGRASFVGGAYVFSQSGGSWSQQQMLLSPDGATQDQFGTSVGLSAVGAIVGAPYRASQRGAAYVFAGPAGPAAVPALGDKSPWFAGLLVLGGLMALGKRRQGEQNAR